MAEQVSYVSDTRLLPLSLTRRKEVRADVGPRTSFGPARRDMTLTLEKVGKEPEDVASI
jgi:hypothetical protein